MKDTHLHFIIWAYDSQAGDTYMNMVTVDLVATDTSEALVRAKILMPGKQYRVASIIEHLGQCSGHG